MEQQPIILKRLRVSSWSLAAFLLIAVFLINNRDLVSGTRVQILGACSFYTPAFMLVADHARNGELLQWNPWLAAGTPDFADPQVAAASPIAVIVGLIGDLLTLRPSEAWHLWRITFRIREPQSHMGCALVSRRPMRPHF
jgi:hypothetical protein